MNAERLNHIVSEIQEEITELGVLDAIEALRAALQNVVNQPQQPQYQQAVADALENLRTILPDATSNWYSPSWKQAIKEIGGANLMGQALLDRINMVFARNQITPTLAVTELTKIKERVTEFSEGIDYTVAGLEALNIKKEALQAGTCDIGYMIPRQAVGNTLTGLYKELHEWSFILGNIAEVVGDETRDFQVKTISSSDFLVYVNGGLAACALLGPALERIIDTYKKILEIKALRNKLKASGVPETATTGIGQHANEMMTKEIKRIVAEVAKEHLKDMESGRRNELANGLTISLNKLANRIDRGYSVEIRVEQLPAAKEEKQSKEDRAKRVLIEKIDKAAAGIEFINFTGEAILMLEETNTKAGKAGKTRKGKISRKPKSGSREKLIGPSGP